MKRFQCGCASRNTLFFESTRCLACERLTGYCPDRGVLLAFDSENSSAQAHDDHWRALCAGQPRYRRCANYRDHAICNWMIPAHESQSLCVACRLNRVIPDLGQATHLRYWGRLEAAKRHALYTVLTLKLPFDDLSFRFMADSDDDSTTPIVTGHCDGEITINLSEADTVARTRTRLQLGERYRTLLGHFRHELGHYFWNRLIATKTQHLHAFRELFGDERADYPACRQHYYQHGPARDWAERHISPYASLHPWEDWAETWAHYMHLRDTLETAADFHLHLQSCPTENSARAIRADGGGEDWITLAIAMNALNRSMGLEDAYPFALNETTRTKLDWINVLAADAAH